MPRSVKNRRFTVPPREDRWCIAAELILPHIRTNPESLVGESADVGLFLVPERRARLSLPLDRRSVAWVPVLEMAVLACDIEIGRSLKHGVRILARHRVEGRLRDV